MSSCCTTTWISLNYTYIPSLLSFPPTPPPIPPSRSTQSTSLRFLYNSNFPPPICFTHANVCISVLLSEFIPPSPSPTVSTSLCTTFASLFPLTDEWMKKLGYIYTMEYYTVMKRNEYVSWMNESVELRWTNLGPIIQSEISQKEKKKHYILMPICGIWKNGTDEQGQLWIENSWPPCISKMWFISQLPSLRTLGYVLCPEGPYA